MKLLPKLLFTLFLISSGFIQAQTIQFNSFEKLCPSINNIDLDNYVNLKKGRWELIDIDGNASGTSEHTAALNRMTDSTQIKGSVPGKYYWRYVNYNNGNPLKDSIYMTINSLPDLSTVRDPAPTCFKDGKFDLDADFPDGANFKWSEKANSQIWYSLVDKRRDTMVERGITGPHWYYTERFYNAGMNHLFIPDPNVDRIRIHVKHTPSGCEDSTTFNVRINPNPIVVLKKADTSCTSGSSFRVNQALILAPPNPEAGIYTWKIDSAPTGLTQFQLNQVLEDRDPGQFAQDYWFNNLYPGTFKLQFCYEDGATNCRTCKFAYVTITDTAKIVFKPLDRFCYSDKIIQLNDYVNLKNGRWELKSFNNFGPGTSPYNQALTRMFDSTRVNVYDEQGKGGIYYWDYINQDGCNVMDSVEMIVSAKPQLIVTELDTICKKDGPVDVSALHITPNKTEFQNGGSGTGWYGPGLISSNRFDPNRVIPSGSKDLYHGPFTLIVRYKHPVTFCENRDTIDVIIENELVLDTQVKQSINTLTSEEDSADYQWVNCDNNLPVQGATQKSFAPSSKGNYKVVLRLGNCNTATSACFSVNSVGVNSLIGPFLKIYPNPVQDKFIIHSADSQVELHSLSIYDIRGRELLKNLSIINGQRFDFNFPKGLYFIKVQTSQGWITQKIMK